MNPRPDVRIVRDTPVTALLDGGGGLGHPTACRAMTLAVEKARRTGVGFVTVRNSNHFGIAGYYAMMALDSGCIGLAMTNSNGWVVPTFGRDARLGTNPIAVAVPAGTERPFVLDMATSTVTIGKLEVHQRLGLPIPLQWATDQSGRPSADPGAVIRGAATMAGGGLLPLGGAGEETGGHKGYGLGAWVEVFSALLSGALCSDRNCDFDADGKPRPGDLGHFFGAWRVEAFRPLAEFRAEMDDWLRRLKAAPKAVGADRIYVAGEKESEEADRRRCEGIPLPEPVVLDLRNLRDTPALTKRFEEHYRRQCGQTPDLVNMTGIYITLVSGLIEIFGWEMLLLGAGTNPAQFGQMANRYATWIQQYFEALAAADVPVVMVHDDIVWSSGPFISPQWYREFVFPNYRKLFAPLRDSGKKIIYTSDGNYTEFIDDVAACGVHGFVMEPSTDMAYVADKYGRSHVFIGNADTRVLLSDTRQRIRAEVERCMAIGKGFPGFFMAVGNHIPANTPVENALYYNQVYEELSRRA